MLLCAVQYAKDGGVGVIVGNEKVRRMFLDLCTEEGLDIKVVPGGLVVGNILWRMFPSMSSTGLRGLSPEVRVYEDHFAEEQRAQKRMDIEAAVEETLERGVAAGHIEQSTNFVRTVVLPGNIHKISLTIEIGV
jgi:hypothetical protein